MTVDNRTHDDKAFFTQNDAFNNILKFAIRYTEHPVCVSVSSTVYLLAVLMISLSFTEILATGPSFVMLTAWRRVSRRIVAVIRNTLPFMEHGRSLRCSQEPVMGSYLS